MEKVDIINILKNDNTVFSFKEILLAFGERNPGLLSRRLSYYVKNGQLYGIRRGIYAKDKVYDRRELATKIFIPSYISFETVLAEAGIIFQYYGQIFVASYQTKEIDCDGQIFSFRKLKENVLNDSSGIENNGHYPIASKERAFLDTVYLNKDYHFDNLTPLDWNKVFSILPIYGNKRMVEKVNDYYKHFISNQG
ncbi:MAG: hypothetical protein PHW52_02665 [Candidatus Pacebacteria bacterium]|nr:hypothetical protein [Candidatus Paceibacterota bacterium]